MFNHLKMSRPKTKPTVYILEKKNNFVTKVSTNTTEEIPNVVFLRAKTRISPLINNKTYENDIINLKKKFDEFARNLLNTIVDYDKNYIFSVDLAEKSVKYKKTSHLHYDLFLKPIKPLTLFQHKEKLEILSNKMDNKLIELFKKYNMQWK